MKAEIARELVTYDPETGEFRWNKPRRKCTPGKLAGSTRADGYVSICLDHRRYYAHRLAFLLMTGEWPALEVDHINGNPRDNRWANLRPVTKAQNMQNLGGAPKTRGSGLMGAAKNREKFYSAIRVDGRTIYLGVFDTAIEAHNRYMDEKQKAHPYSARAKRVTNGRDK